MAHEMMLLALQMGVILLTAKLFGWVFSTHLKQPKVLGELVAGMLIGPYVLGAIPLGHLGPLFPLAEGTIPVSPELYGIATIGSIFLLFSSGLETDLPTFLRFSGKASVVGVGGVIISFFLGAGATVVLHPEVHSLMAPEALFLGTICTATSIGITARILGETKKISTPEGVTILAAAVLDDVISIILLSVVVGVASVSMNGGSLAWSSIGFIAFKAVAFWALCMVGGILAAPYLTKGMKRLESLSLIAQLSFGIALLLAGFSEMAGLAMIIGAYIAGLSFSQTDVAQEIIERITGVGDYFVPVFFAVMGMMVNFQALLGVLLFGLAFSLVAFLGKLIGCGLPALIVGFNVKGAFRIGAGMLPRGEVTLIVGGIGLATGAIGQDLFGVAVMTMLIASISAPPLLIASFRGGSGYTKELMSVTVDDTVTIDVALPSRRASDFVRRSLQDAFRQEGFFVKRLEGAQEGWQIRKDEMVFTMGLREHNIEITAKKEHEAFIRLMMVETMVDFKEFVDSLQGMNNEDMMGANLLMNMFAGESEETI